MREGNRMQGVDWLESGYYLEYMCQTCFDDGGLGHDSWWETLRVHLHEAKTDKAAKELAQKILKPGRGCNGSFCNNRGERRFLKLEKIQTKIDRTVKTLRLPKG